jgi:hypothetical protein
VAAGDIETTAFAVREFWLMDGGSRFVANRILINVQELVVEIEQGKTKD